MTKTAATVLQELMVKLGDTPDYKCVNQSGPEHMVMFEYHCSARGVTVMAAARSKKEAKQEAARLMLLELGARGLADVPAPYGAPSAPAPQQVSRSYKSLLKELCEEYRLPGVQYNVVGDTGPAHARQFTVEATVGHQRRTSTATTKKAAHQLAAEQLYHYFRENLAKLTEDFVEEDALARAHEKAMDRYVETRAGAGARRPNLSLRISDYHRGLRNQLDETQREEALVHLAKDAEPQRQLQELVDKLGLQLHYTELGAVSVVQVEGCSPMLALAGTSRARAAAEAPAYLRLALASGDY